MYMYILPGSISFHCKGILVATEVLLRHYITQTYIVHVHLRVIGTCIYKLHRRQLYGVELPVTSNMVKTVIPSDIGLCECDAS